MLDERERHWRIVIKLVLWFVSGPIGVHYEYDFHLYRLGSYHPLCLGLGVYSSLYLSSI
jgi:hypothetical protein